MWLRQAGPRLHYLATALSDLKSSNLGYYCSTISTTPFVAENGELSQKEDTTAGLTQVELLILNQCVFNPKQYLNLFSLIVFITKTKLHALCCIFFYKRKKDCELSCKTLGKY